MNVYYHHGHCLQVIGTLIIILFNILIAYHYFLEGTVSPFSYSYCNISLPCSSFPQNVKKSNMRIWESYCAAKHSGEITP